MTRTPLVQLTDPAALSLLTTERVEAYLLAKRWRLQWREVGALWTNIKGTGDDIWSVMVREPFGELNQLQAFEGRSALEIWAEILGLRVVIEPDSSQVDDIMSLPYQMQFVYDEETRTYTATVLEFPGCAAQGDSAEETLERLKAAARSWIVAALDMGQAIPPPDRAAPRNPRPEPGT